MEKEYNFDDFDFQGWLRKVRRKPDEEEEEDILDVLKREAPAWGIQVIDPDDL